MKDFHISIRQALQKLHQESGPIANLMKEGNFSIEYYAPRGVDNQTPHAQDEIYIITSGTAGFFRNGEMVSCKANDILYVPKGMHHHFLDMSHDFGTWVIFFGE